MHTGPSVRLCVAEHCQVWQLGGNLVLRTRQAEWVRRRCGHCCSGKEA